MRRFIFLISFFMVGTRISAMENNDSTLVKVPGAQATLPLSSRPINTQQPECAHNCFYVKSAVTAENPTFNIAREQRRLWQLLQTTDIIDERSSEEIKKIIKATLEISQATQINSHTHEHESYSIDDCSNIYAQFITSNVPVTAPEAEKPASPEVVKHKFSLLDILKPRTVVKVAQ